MENLARATAPRVVGGRREHWTRRIGGRPHHGLTLWDLSAAQAVAKLPGAAVPGIVTPDGKTLITAGWESVLLWDAQTGEPAPIPLLTPEVNDWPYDIAVTPHGGRIAV